MKRKIILNIGLLFIVGWVSSTSISQAGSNITIIDNVNNVRLSLDFIEKDSCVLISVSEIAKVFRASIAWNPITKKIVLRKGNESITFNIGSSDVSINNRTVKMSSPAELITGRVYIPLKFITQEFARILDIQISWNSDNNRLTISPTDISPVSLTNQSRVSKRDLSIRDEILEIESQLSKKGISPEQFKIKTIVIDAGHGGKDPGAIGSSGLLEKTVTLDMALELRDVLCQYLPDVQILMTRDGDYFVPLRDRTAFANYKKADLFICLHSNAASSRSASGFEVYYLSPEASDNEARSLAAAENEVLRFEEKDFSKKGLNTTEFILGSLAQEEFINESIKLAGLIQQYAVDNLGIEDRGIKGAFFWVIKDAMMPAVLIENGFISNPLEESRLRSKDFRKSIVNVIAQAIIDYKDSYEGNLKEDE